MTLQSARGEVRASETASPVRRVVGLLRIAAGLLVLASIVTQITDALTGWYPYPFLEPATGAISVIAYIVGIAAFIIGIASLAIAYGRRKAH